MPLAAACSFPTVDFGGDGGAPSGPSTSTTSTTAPTTTTTGDPSTTSSSGDTTTTTSSGGGDGGTGGSTSSSGGGGSTSDGGGGAGGSPPPLGDGYCPAGSVDINGFDIEDCQYLPRDSTTTAGVGGSGGAGGGPPDVGMGDCDGDGVINAEDECQPCDPDVPWAEAVDVFTTEPYLDVTGEESWDWNCDYSEQADLDFSSSGCAAESACAEDFVYIEPPQCGAPAAYQQCETYYVLIVPKCRSAGATFNQDVACR